MIFTFSIQDMGIKMETGKSKLLKNQEAISSVFNKFCSSGTAARFQKNIVVCTFILTPVILGSGVSDWLTSTKNIRKM